MLRGDIQPAALVDQVVASSKASWLLCTDRRGMVWPGCAKSICAPSRRQPSPR